VLDIRHSLFDINSFNLTTLPYRRVTRLGIV
jgi:hypothetical protein